MTRGKLKTLLNTLLANTEGAAVFTDTQQEVFLYEGAQITQDIIEEADPSLFLSQASLVVAADELSVQLSNIRQIHSIEMLRGNRSYPVRNIPLKTLATYKEHTRNTGFRCSPVYYLQGNAINYPYSLGEEHTLVVNYTVQIQDLVSDDEEWPQFPPQAQSHIAHEAAYLALVAENASVTSFMNQLMPKRNRLVNSIATRMRSESMSVTWRPEDFD